MRDALLVALQTLTRLPVPPLREAPSAATLGLSGVFYPLVGVLPAGVGMAVYQALPAAIPWQVGALLTLALWALLTGALHEDGLADTADALGSQATAEGALRVMKDTQVGAYGVLALVLATLLRWQALALQSPEKRMAALLACQVLPRAGMVALAFAAGPATEGSGGRFAASLRGLHVAGSIALGLGLSAAAGRSITAVAALACAIVVVLASLWFRRRLGGVTGDCLGAAFLAQEIAVLGLLAVRP